MIIKSMMVRRGAAPSQLHAASAAARRPTPRPQALSLRADHRIPQARPARTPGRRRTIESAARTGAAAMSRPAAKAEARNSAARGASRVATGNGYGCGGTLQLGAACTGGTPTKTVRNILNLNKDATVRANVAQPGQSIRLVSERSWVRIPSLARHDLIAQQKPRGRGGGSLGSFVAAEPAVVSTAGRHRTPGLVCKLLPDCPR